MDFGSFKAGDEVPWDFGIPELPPLALACMAMVEPGTDSMFSVLAAGAHAASIWVEENTGSGYNAYGTLQRFGFASMGSSWKKR